MLDSYLVITKLLVLGLPEFELLFQHDPIAVVESVLSPSLDLHLLNPKPQALSCDQLRPPLNDLLLCFKSTHNDFETVESFQLDFSGQMLECSNTLNLKDLSLSGVQLQSLKGFNLKYYRILLCTHLLVSSFLSNPFQNPQHFLDKSLLIMYICLPSCEHL
jgi:hypothetical protein